MDIGTMIKNRRLELGLTLEDVGNAVGVGKSTVQKWENGFISNMRRDKIAALSRVLDLDPISFIDDSEPKTPSFDVGIRIKNLRETKGLSQEELGKIVGVQRAAVQKWENGATQNLKRRTIQKLADYFSVNPANFIDDNAPKNIPSEIESYLSMQNIIADIQNNINSTYIVHGSHGKGVALKSASDKDCRLLVNDGEIFDLTETEAQVLQKTLEALRAALETESK